MPLALDQVGLSVVNLESSARWWADAVRGEMSLEDPVDVDKSMLAMDAATAVRLQRATIRVGRTDTWLALYEFIHPKAHLGPGFFADRGIGHISLRTDDLADLTREFRRLRTLGVEWHGEPRIEESPRGLYWVFGQTPQSSGARVMLGLNYRAPAFP